MVIAMHMRLLQVGDRVALNRATMMDAAGSRGTVTRKYVPAHCTGAWSVTVRWDGNAHETSYPYPTGGLLAFDDGAVV